MMKHSLRHYSFLWIRCLSILILAGGFLLTSSVSAYNAGAKWQNAMFWDYNVDPGIETVIASGATNQVTLAASKWNTGRFQLRQIGSYNGTGNFVTYYNLEGDPRYLPCGIPDPRTTYAVNCIFADPVSIYTNHIYFNSSANFSWNTYGDQNCDYAHRTHADVFATVLHELGHSFSLRDYPLNHTEAGMSFKNCYAQTYLAEDDRDGIAMLYGARTNWESEFADGLINRQAYSNNVTGYYGTSLPELGPRFAENGVPPYASKYEVLAGSGQAGYSFGYQTLFTSAEDTGPEHNYLQIRPGMQLKWLQYNYQQSSMGPDLQLVRKDNYGNTFRMNLRDSGLVDTMGVGVHPVARSYYGTGYWFFNTIDLSPLAASAWRIEQWMIAYDNGNNGRTGQYRAYFDNFRVEYPP